MAGLRYYLPPSQVRPARQTLEAGHHHGAPKRDSGSGQYGDQRSHVSERGPEICPTPGETILGSSGSSQPGSLPKYLDPRVVRRIAWEPFSKSSAARTRDGLPTGRRRAEAALWRAAKAESRRYSRLGNLRYGRVALGCNQSPLWHKGCWYLYKAVNRLIHNYFYDKV